MNGTMTEVPAASNDPIFTFHHAFVDYILEMWIRRHNGEFQPPPGDDSAAKGHNYDDIIVPFLPIHRVHEMFVESEKLGWTYESLEGLDINSISCEVHTFDNDSEVLYPDSSQIQPQETLPDNVQDQNINGVKHMKSLQHFREFSIDSTMKNAFSSIVNNPQVRLESQVWDKNAHYQQEIPTTSVCVFTSEELVFPIPSGCDKLVFQSNVILPSRLTLFSWYSCTPWHTHSGTFYANNHIGTNFGTQTYYICNRIA